MKSYRIADRQKWNKIRISKFLIFFKFKLWNSSQRPISMLVHCTTTLWVWVEKCLQIQNPTIDWTQPAFVIECFEFVPDFTDCLCVHECEKIKFFEKNLYLLASFECDHSHHTIHLIGTWRTHICSKWMNTHL